MTLHCGDCLTLMRGMEPESVDAIVCDPPAGIFFMSKSWDHHKGGRDAWIAWLAEVMREGLRLLKPGGHALVWALPRTSHWTGMALEDAGFEVRDRISHLFGSGFPKSLDVGKAMDKQAGASRHARTVKLDADLLEPEREVVEENPNILRAHRSQNGTIAFGGDGSANVTTAATDLAKQWDGWGTALKPGAEDWWLCRKPLTSTVAANVSEWGTGAINVDGCRIAGVMNGTWGARQASSIGYHGTEPADYRTQKHDSGRWPANVVLSHTPECREVGTKKVKGSQPRESTGSRQRQSGFAMTDGNGGFADADGTETVTAWECVEGCPVRMLDEQSGSLRARGNVSPTKRRQSNGSWGQNGSQYGVGPDGPVQSGDTGGASRFYYCAKASRSEREAGLDGADRKAKLWSSGTQNPGSFQAGGTDRTSTNHHPCVKPLQLMRWLTRLVTPPNGVILDPFAGSFSTGCAAILEGFRFIGIEQDAEYCEIGRRRMAYWQNQRDNVPPSLWDVA